MVSISYNDILSSCAILFMSLGLFVKKTFSCIFCVTCSFMLCDKEFKQKGPSGNGHKKKFSPWEGCSTVG